MDRPSRPAGHELRQSRAGDHVRGFKMAPSAALVLFRRPPLAPTPEPLAGGDGLRLPVASLVAPGGTEDGPLRWQASSDDAVATARIRDGMLEVEPTPGAEGVVDIVLTATNASGFETTVRFEVRVEFFWPPRRAGGWRTVMPTLSAPKPTE